VPNFVAMSLGLETEVPPVRSTNLIYSLPNCHPKRMPVVVECSAMAYSPVSHYLLELDNVNV